MGERKGVNKYYPPDYDPTKGGLNAYHGTHALRERASKIHEGIIIIRFEMPYNIWCNGCGNHIGMGVRYNSQKRRMGFYYSTPIYKFRMKCHLCDQYFEIQTDPKNCDYQILSGCRRKEERWDTEKAGNVQTTHREVKERLMTNAMFRLEHNAEDKVKVNKLAPTLTRLEEMRDDWDDDFAVNRQLRRKFRQEKNEINEKQSADDLLKQRHNLPEDFQLLNEENEEDIARSKQMRFGEGDSRPDLVRKKRRTSIKQSSIFENITTEEDSKKLKLQNSIIPNTDSFHKNEKTNKTGQNFGIRRKSRLSHVKSKSLSDSQQMDKKKDKALVAYQSSSSSSDVEDNEPV